MLWLRRALPLLPLLPLLLCTPLAVAASERNTTTCQGRYFWTLIDVDRDVVASLLPDDVTLLTPPPPPSTPPPPPPRSTTPATHPVYFEFNHQINCSVAGLPHWLDTTMFEFKVEVPFVARRGVVSPTMFKPQVYESALADVLGTRVTFGLPTRLGHAMQRSSNASAGVFSLRSAAAPSAPGLRAHFAAAGAWQPALTSDTFRTTFVEINTHAWLCYPPLTLAPRTPHCAFDFYSWPTSRVRPLLADVVVDAAVLPAGMAAPAHYSTSGGGGGGGGGGGSSSSNNKHNNNKHSDDDRSSADVLSGVVVAAFEVETVLTITNAFVCPAADGQRADASVTAVEHRRR